MIEQQLSAARDERLQIRVDGVEGPVVRFVGQRHVAVEIERSPIPLGVLVHHVAEMVHRNLEGLRTSQSGPTQLASHLQAGKDFLPRARVFRRAVDLASHFHLRRREAVGGVVVLAFEHLRIEAAARRIFQNAIADAVKRVARLDGGFMDERILGGRDKPCLILVRHMRDP